MPCNAQTTTTKTQVRYFIVDFARVRNMDHSSGRAFTEMARAATSAGIVLVFTGMNPKVLNHMQAHGVVPYSGNRPPVAPPSAYTANAAKQEVRAALVVHVRYVMSDRRGLFCAFLNVVFCFCFLCICEFCVCCFFCAFVHFVCVFFVHF